MNHYLDIRLRTDPEFTQHQLMSALYSKLHRALVELATTKIGVSFPEQNEKAPNLGDRLRLHGSDAELAALHATPWLQGMRDLVVLAAPLEVPSDARHRHVYRVQAKSGVERLRRRAMRRHGIDADTAREKIPDNAAERLTLPFIQLGSRSTGQPRFHLYIQHGPLQDQPSPGAFSAYGLSTEASVPWF